MYPVIQRLPWEASDTTYYTANSRRTFEVSARPRPINALLKQGVQIVFTGVGACLYRFLETPVGRGDPSWWPTQGV